MLPGRERLKEIAARSGGSLTEVRYPVLLAALALAKRDCLAVLKRRQTEKRIFFRGGVPEECLSNLLHETFGRFLVGQGKLTEDDFSLAFAQANASGLRLGEVLVERGAFSKEEVRRLLATNLARKLLDGFTWNEGTFELLPDPPPIDAPPRINVAQLIVAGVSRFAPQAAVDQAIGTLVGKPLAIHPSPVFSMEEIRLTEGQSRLAAALAKRPRIDELATSVDLPFEEISRILYALWLLGTVVTADGVPRAAAPQAPAPPAPKAPAPRAPEPAAAPAPHAPPPAPPSRSPEATPLPGSLRHAYETLRGVDSFDLLGLADEASEEAIRRRYLERARDWAPWQFEGNEIETGRATALFLAAARAYGELTDSRARESLQRSRRVTGQAVKQSPTQYFALKTDVLDPEGQHRKGAELLAAGKPKQALPLLELASECDAQNGAWAAEAAWCRFLAADKHDAAAALAELDEAFRIDARAGIALFYAGELLRARGDTARAETYYRRAAKVMSPDRRPLDALREMARSAPR